MYTLDAIVKWVLDEGSWEGHFMIISIHGERMLIPRSGKDFADGLLKLLLLD